MGNSKQAFFDKIGIPHSLAWGYLGILIFMMGDGMEQGWLSPYLIEKGMTIGQSALLFTIKNGLLQPSQDFLPFHLSGSFKRINQKKGFLIT